MAGVFSKASRPKRPGAYFNFVAAEQQPVLVATTGIVAVPVTHDWGPDSQVVEVTSLGDFSAKFGGDSFDGGTLSRAYRAVVQAFQGEGLPGRGGAGSVLVYRMAGTDAAYATYSFSGAGGTLALRARWRGTFGNKLRVTVEANAKNPGSQDDFVVLNGTRELERYTHDRGDATGLADALRERSDWLDYTGTPADGTGLAASSAAFTGGNDGLTLTAGSYTAAQAAFESFRFSLVATDVTDGGVLTSFVSWGKTLNQRGQRAMIVVGGATGESAATAVARSATINDPNFVNVGIGSYRDARLGDLSPAELSFRIAGILARKGDRENLTFARLAGVEIVSGPSVGDILDAIDGGVLTLAKDSHPDAPVRVEKGLTAFVDEADADRPRNIYSVPKFVRTIHILEREFTEWAEINVIGRLPVNERTRAYVRTEMESRMAVREEDGVIAPGWTVTTDPDPAPTEQDDFIALLYQMTFGRSLEQILNTVVVA